MRLRSSLKCLSVFGILTLVSLVSPLKAQVTDADVHQAIEKSIPYLWEKGQSWIDNRGCVSCHQVPFMVWSLNAASHKGFDIDSDRLMELKNWSTQVVNFDNPKSAADRTDEQRLTSNTDTISQLLLALRYDNQDAETDFLWRITFNDALLNNQAEDGSWVPCGQLPSQKRDKAETTEVTTAWTLLSLDQRTEPDKLELASIEFSESGQSTEWWATQLLLAWTNQNGEKCKELMAQLLQRQNEDGGWGWLVDDPSDAFGTGLALYSLAIADCSDQSVIDRGKQFLINSQTKSGGWEVNSTKAKHKDKVTPTASYWGSAWAVIGLLETLPEPKPE